MIKDRNISLFLLVAKFIKIVGIRLSFLLPSLRAKVILKILDCPYGKNLQVCGKVYFRPNGKGSIKLGDNVKITARFLTNSVGITNPVMFECIDDGRIEIGHHSGLTSTIISSRSFVKIGNYVKIGGNVRIFDHDFHSTDFEHRRDSCSDREHIKTAGVIIEDDVLIGTNAMILKGVHIGARSIVGAGSVVTCKNIPPDSLVIGNPAKIIESNRVYI